MAGNVPNQDIFDVRKIRRLVELMKEHDLGEIDIRQGDTRIPIPIRRPTPC
jgi:acetyl-CoA carboxylase biotin carboxyl carrier protein